MAQLADTTREVIATFPTLRMKGLYFIYNGERLTPSRIYFSSDLREFRNDPHAYGGRAYCHYDNALRPVMMPNGKPYAHEELRNVVADYNGISIYNYRRE